MKRSSFVFAILAVLSIAAFVATINLPAAAQTDNGNGNGNGNQQRLNTDLTQNKAVGAVTPKGKARYRESRNGNKVLVVNANRIDRPAGTTLTVRACGRNVGTMTLSTGKLYQRGRIRLRSRDGDSIPNCGGGSTVTAAGGPVDLAGRF